VYISYDSHALFGHAVFSWVLFDFSDVADAVVCDTVLSFHQSAGLCQISGCDRSVYIFGVVGLFNTQGSGPQSVFGIKILSSHDPVHLAIMLTCWLL